MAFLRLALTRNRIVDDKGDEVVEYGLRGELLVRGTIIMSGYLDNPEAAERAFDGGWLRTGDIACFGEGGKLYIVDRIKVSNSIAQCGGTSADI